MRKNKPEWLVSLGALGALALAGAFVGPGAAAEGAAPIVAWIFHPSQPWIQPEPYEARLQQAGIPYERIKLFDFTVFIMDRRR